MKQPISVRTLSDMLSHAKEHPTTSQVKLGTQLLAESIARDLERKVDDAKRLISGDLKPDSYEAMMLRFTMQSVQEAVIDISNKGLAGYAKEIVDKHLIHFESEYGSVYLPTTRTA